MRNNILVVEDSATQAEALRGILEREGFAVTVARSAEDAIAFLGERDVDLVLSDVMMPGADGYELTRRIKGELGRPDLRVILLTSLGDPMDIVRGLECGADNYITKPYTPDILLARVRHVLANRDLRRSFKASLGVQVEFMGSRLNISSDKEQILDLLLSSVEDVVRTNRALHESQRELAEAHAQLQDYATQMAHVAHVWTGKYQTLTHHARDAIFVLDEEGRIVEANAEAARLLACPAETLPGRPMVELVVPEDRGRFAEAITGLLPGGQIELRDLRLAGSEAREPVYCDFSAAVAAVEGEALALVIAHDVSERRAAEQRLRESEERYRLLFEHNPRPMWVYDIATLRFLAVNEAAVRHYGYTREEFLAMTLADLRPPEDVATLAALLPTDASAPGAVHEVVHRTRDGRHIDVRAIGLTIDFGERPARLVLAEDVTEQKRTAAALRAREWQQAAVAELGQRALSGADVATLHREAVALVADTLDTDLAAVFEYVPADEQLLLRAGAGWPAEMVGTQRIPAGASSHAGYTMLRGEPVVMLDAALERRFTLQPQLAALKVVSGVSVPIAGGEQPFGVLSAHTRRPREFTSDDVNFLRGVAGVLGAAQARERATQALRDSEARARAIVSALSEGVILVGPDGTIQEVNESVCRIFNKRPEELIGQSTLMAQVPTLREDGSVLLPEDFPPAYVLRTGRPHPHTVIALHVVPERPIWLSVAAQPLTRPGETTPYSVVVSILDITERKRLEEQVVQSQRIEAVGQLAGGVAHDFNNILTVIKSYSEMALDGLDAAHDARGDVEEIRKAADRAAALTRQLLAFSRRQVLQPRVCNLNLVVQDMEKMLRRLIREDIEFSMGLDPALESILADPGQLEQVLMNLVVNARDAMPEGGRVTIETSTVDVDTVQAAEHVGVTPGRYVLLAVTDTGTGMPPEVQARLFEPFFTTKPKGKGTGLGLATVYGIVKQSGGHIWVYSEPGRGTTFKLYFPVAADAAPAAAGAAAGDAPVRLPTHLAGSGETILVAEDEETVRRVLVRQLRKHGYRVLEAPTGGEALQIAQAHTGTIHLLVTDMIMPELNGRELAERLKHVHPETRVLYTSGYTERVFSQGDALEPGFALLEKPFTLDGLARKVREALAAPTRATEPA